MKIKTLAIGVSLAALTLTGCPAPKKTDAKSSSAPAASAPAKSGSAAAPSAAPAKSE